MIIKTVGLLASIPVGLMAAVAGTGIVVVDVQELGPDGHHIVVPVPLVALRTAMAFVPPQRPGGNWQEAAPHLEAARDVLAALAEAPDGELVRVEEPGEQVIVAKEGSLLHVRVHGKDEDVDVNVPLALALQALPGRDGFFSPAALAGALGSARFTDLVDVRSGDEHVRVTVY